MSPILLALGQDPAVVTHAAAYFKGLSFGLIADFGKFAIFQYLAAYGRPRVAVITHLVALPVLVGLNICLVWGYGPFPELGMFGLGLGTAITYWFAFALMLAYILLSKRYNVAIFLHTSLSKLLTTMQEMLKLGVPIGLMFLIEITLFMIVALLMGRIGTITLAAHQIAMQMLGITILFAFGFAEAVTILVGKAAGAKNRILAREVAIVGMIISLCIMLVVALSHWLLPEAIIGLDVDMHDPYNEELIAFAIGFLMLSALFQLFDSARIVAAGALRGLKDSQYPMWVALISFWFIGLPIGYFFAFYLDWGGMGLWSGLIAAVVVSLLLQVRRLMRQL
jgi:MATE family multidrug resistance protein